MNQHLTAPIEARTYEELIVKVDALKPMNGLSPKQIILVAVGMMLSECAGDVGGFGDQSAVAKRTFQRKHYINNILSRGISMATRYGGLDAEPRSVEALKSDQTSNPKKPDER